LDCVKAAQHRGAVAVLDLERLGRGALNLAAEVSIRRALDLCERPREIERPLLKAIDRLPRRGCLDSPDLQIPAEGGCGREAAHQCRHRVLVDSERRA